MSAQRDSYKLEEYLPAAVSGEAGGCGLGSKLLAAPPDPEQVFFSL